MARWMIKKDFEGTDFIICSACNCAMNFEYYFEPWHFKYCPYCGEFMDNHGEHEILLDVTNMLAEANECNKENDEEHHNNLVTENDTEIPKYTTEWASSDDCISRQAAIDYLNKLLDGRFDAGKSAMIQGIRDSIRCLPSLEPPTKVVAQIKVDTEEVVKRAKEEYEIKDRPVCEDAISRADTIKAMCSECEFKDEFRCGGDCTEVAVVKGMPPVEPKRPKTTETMMVNGEPTEIDPLSYEVGYTHGQFSDRPKGEWIDTSEGTFCSECDFKTNEYYNYCPNCGCDCRGDEDV